MGKNSQETKKQADGNISDALIEGANAICKSINRSEPTLMRLISQYDLSKKGIIFKRGGIWVANRKKLKKFWIGYLSGNTENLED